MMIEMGLTVNGDVGNVDASKIGGAESPLMQRMVNIHKCTVKCQWGDEGLCHHAYFWLLACSDAACENAVHPHCQRKWEDETKNSLFTSSQLSNGCQS